MTQMARPQACGVAWLLFPNSRDYYCNTLQCELNLIGRPCGTGWANKESNYHCSKLEHPPCWDIS